jgi:hypothetical protein
MYKARLSTRTAKPHKLRVGGKRKQLRPRRAKGVPGWWARLRFLLWSWWLWAGLAVIAFLDDREGTALGLGIAAIVLYLFAPRERTPTYGLDHEFAIESDEFLSTVVGATGAPFFTGK